VIGRLIGGLALASLALVPAACGGGNSNAPHPCGSAAAWGDRMVHVTAGGLDRQYILHVPAAYTGGKRVPLVVVMHGFGADGTREANRNPGWTQKADAEGFIVVFPTGSPIPPEAGYSGTEWSAGSGSIPAPSAADDVGFIRTIVAAISAEQCIDPARIYATGESNGGAMAHSLACQAGDLFAAVPAMDADLVGSPCNPSRPMPVLFFRATDDMVAPYGGGEVLPGVITPGALASFQEWSLHDVCPGEPVATNSTCSTYTSCNPGGEIVLCSLAPNPGGPAIDHGGSYTYPFANGFNVIDYAWTFLQRFTLP